ncbi:MBL fold metallo-hydrolase [Myxococcus sp. RHSTA-1-4]|uniref:MBL fold metallo-hydrolase n=1 Tax=Myxococcus sp. RHSTA-1-4 TaxID=2874601 RepID=UPI001CC0181A|nr:MBL fold metallo-hydrolase [Myxococcus sp. RHSTA-1-4]
MRGDVEVRTFTREFLGRWRREEDEGATYTPYPADVVVGAPTDLASLTGVPGRILPVPGHTKGSLVVEVGDMLFVGDLLRGSLIGSGAETHLYMCDLEANRRDIRTLLEQQSPGSKWVFVGHFGPVTRESVLEHFEAEKR